MYPFLFQDVNQNWGGSMTRSKRLRQQQRAHANRDVSRTRAGSRDQRIDTVYVTNHRKTRNTISLFTHTRMYHRVSRDLSNGHTTVSLPLPLAELHNRGIDPFLPQISLACGSTISTVRINVNFNSNVSRTLRRSGTRRIIYSLVYAYL